jgi:alpha-tubulin suppressor-like RCC1 family protein
MLNFKKLLVSTFLGGMLSSNVSAQADLIISGGNNVSSFVCANRKAYTWGNNTNTLGTGLLGNGSTAAIVNTPTAVAIPGGLDIQQINSGSGAHFLALTCESSLNMGGGIFAWGNNEFGQVGNGTSGNNVTTPTRVKLGALPAGAYDPTGTGFITAGIAAVYAAYSNSYAITTVGTLIAWGLNSAASNLQNYDNASGMLGDGSTTNKNTPVYVRSGVNSDGQTNGQPLRGVIQVYATDNVAYALVDPDGDGLGSVYSWGYGSNGTLGRNAAGTANPVSFATIQDSYARPVFYGGSGGGTGPMNNIVAISAGDVFGMALDDQGYVWTWGNGGWNNATGNTILHYTGSDPRRVIAGNTTGSSNDGTYLLAKSIGGGQGYGMAVAADGKPVAWGGQGLVAEGTNPACSYGGLTGTGTTLGVTEGDPGTGQAVKPSYIRGPANIVHNDVLAVFRGDTWGYYQRSDGSIYTWGCNIYGQLGIGNMANQSTAVLFTPPAGCSIPDPKPYVNLTPYDIITCASKLAASPVVLNSGFSIAPGLASSYQVIWRNGYDLVKTGPATAANLTYNAISPGSYSVTIKYVGSNAGCTPYPEATASATISAFPKTFTDPSNLWYCGDVSNVKVNSTGTDNPVYKFYPTMASTTAMGTTVGSASTVINLSSVVATVDGLKTIYVEEASQMSGIVLSKTQSCDPTFNSFEYLRTSSNSPFYQSGFTTFEDNVTLTTLNIRLRSTLFNVGTYSATLNFGVYGSIVGNNGTVANSADLIGSFTYNFTRTRTTDPSDLISDYMVTVNIKLPKAGTYFISLKPTPLTSVTGSGDLSIGNGRCAQNLPVQSLPAGIISYTHNSMYFQNPHIGSSLGSGQFFNVGFETSQGFCDRIPVTLRQNCPCNPPAAVTITASPAIIGSPKVITVCEGGTAPILSGAYTKGASVNTNNYFYSWYKKGTLPAYTNSGSQTAGSATVGIPVLPSTSASAGTYYLRVEDGNFGQSSCYKTDSVLVTVLAKTNTNCTVTGVSESNEINNTIRVSPSPFKEQFMLETSGMEKVLIHDQRGVLIEEKSLLNLSNIQLGQTWSSGLYMLQLVGNGTVKTVKVIKEQ